MITPHIQVDGLAELQRDLKRAEGKLPKALGEAHKEIGRFVISKLPSADPHAIGAGAGSTIRPSATKKEVLLRVGGSHRSTRAGERNVPTSHLQWGKKEVQPFVGGGRPYIVGTIEEYEDEILDRYWQEIEKAVGFAFYSTR